MMMLRTTSRLLLRPRGVAAFTTAAAADAPEDGSSSAATSFSSKRRRSLALSVHFFQPDLNMKQPEILSRATAFLLSVDGKSYRDDTSLSAGVSTRHDHLKLDKIRREERKFRLMKGHSRVAGDPDRSLIDMGYLEYVPREARPNVHIVTSSHVLSPFLWKDYYPQEWLSSVRQEHCTYTLEVYDDNDDDNAASSSSLSPHQPLVTLPLDSNPYHHPEGRDIALIHFRHEREALEQLRDVNVQVLHLRSPDRRFQKGEHVTFEGFAVQDDETIDKNNLPAAAEQAHHHDDPDYQDERIFRPYVEYGTLDYHSEDRFFATTPRLLPGGLCGAPALDAHGDCCGTVEGIVPMSHGNKKLAGTAAFMPSFVMQVFVDFVERGLVQKMMPPDLFQLVEIAKKTNSIGGGLFKQDENGAYTAETDWEQEYDKAMARLKDRYSEQELQAIMHVVRDERDQVLQEMEEEGGDLDEIITRVRQKTLETKAMIHDQILKHIESSSSSTTTISSSTTTPPSFGPSSSSGHHDTNNKAAF
jgi:hypothetical protein